MDEKELGSIKGWFAGRLPDGWFSGVDVSIEDDQIVVLGKLVEEAPAQGDAAYQEGYAAGRIGRFRDDSRRDRIGIAREAEERFGRYVTWGAALGGVTKRFTPGGSGSSRGHGHGRHGRAAAQTF